MSWAVSLADLHQYVYNRMSDFVNLMDWEKDVYIIAGQNNGLYTLNFVTDSKKQLLR